MIYAIKEIDVNHRSQIIDSGKKRMWFEQNWFRYLLNVLMFPCLPISLYKNY